MASKIPQKYQALIFKTDTRLVAKILRIQTN
jgi:hypothetical protein